MKRPRLIGTLVLVGFLALLLAGCSGSASPRGWAGPVESSDELIVATGSSRLDGLDSSGRRVWRFPEIWQIEDGSDDLDGIYGKPVFSSDGTVIFLGDYNGHVYAFRPGDFEEGVTVTQPFAAALDLGEPVIGGVALNQGANLLYAAAGSKLYSINAVEFATRIETRGEPPRHAVIFEAGDEIWGTPVLAGDKLLFTSLDGYLYAVHPVSGDLIWRFGAGEGLVSTPVIAGDRVLVAGFGSTLYAVDLDDGTRQWAFTAQHWIWGEPTIGGNSAYFGDFDGVVRAVDMNGGDEIWSIGLDKGPIRASPAIASGTLLVSTDSGWLVGIDIASREIAWQRDVGSAMNADITVDGASVYIAPRGCVTPEGGGERVYYVQVNPANGDLTAARGVC